MLFALWDYLNYRNRQGRYSDSQSDGGMAVAFPDSIPESQIDQFRDGDLVFTQRLDSFLSWVMMYFTSSPVDHVAIYIGNGDVLHMTLSGSKLHSIRALARGTRILVVRMTAEQRAHFNHDSALLSARIDKGSQLSRRLPPKAQIAVSGLKLIHGKYPDRFRVTIWLELFLSVLLIGTAIWLITETLAGFVIPAASLLALLHFHAASLLRHFQAQPPWIMSHPDLAYGSFFKAGGLMFTKIGPIAVAEFGLLPLNVIFDLARQEDDDDRQPIRRLIEGWNVSELAQKSGNDNSQ